MKKRINRILYILAVGVTMHSCVTSNKCNEKFPSKELPSDTTMSRVDTVYLLKDVEVKLDPIDYYSDWWRFDDLPKDGVVDLPKMDPSQKGSASIETKGDKFKVNCKLDSMNAIIDSLEIELSYNTILVNNYQQLYVDESLKLKQLKAEQKSAVQSAKADKWKQVKGIILYSFLFLVFLLAIFLAIKYLR